MPAKVVIPVKPAPAGFKRGAGIQEKTGFRVKPGMTDPKRLMRQRFLRRIRLTQFLTLLSFRLLISLHRGKISPQPVQVYGDYYGERINEVVIARSEATRQSN